MRLLILLCLGYIVTLISCCNNTDSKNNIEGCKNELLSFLTDSTAIFENVTDFDIKGDLQGSKASIKYYSISEENFFSALKRNVENVRLFNRKFKLNEKLNLENSSRKDSVLKIGESNTYAKFIDLKENKFHRARHYFLEDKIGKYYVIRKIQFEDAETIFWNSKTGEKEFHLLGLSVYTNTKDSLVFYSSPMRGFPDDIEPVCLMKVGKDKIDTLIYVKTNWYPKFAFFDEKDSSMYYIHSFYEDYKLRSTYAKMDYVLY